MCILKYLDVADYRFPSFMCDFQQVTHKGGESVINYIKIFQNAHALSVSVGDSYSEDQLMHTFLINFEQGGNIQLR